MSPLWQSYRPVRNVIDEALGHRDPLDATRDYYQFRENGRFGSHPLHDAFNDESEA